MTSPALMNQCNPTADEVGGHLPQSVISASRPTVFDDDILTLNVASFIQAPMERGDELCEGTGRLAVEPPNHRHRLLRARRERPRGRRAVEQRDELAPSNVRHGHSRGVFRTLSLPQ
jgi:hypothetical protein